MQESKSVDRHICMPACEQVHADLVIKLVASLDYIADGTSGKVLNLVQD